MSDLHELLTRYGDYTDDVAEPLTLAEVLERIEASPSRRTPGWRRSPLGVAVAAAIAVVMLIGIPLWLFAPSGEDPVTEATTTLPPTTTTEITSTTVAPASVEPPSYDAVPPFSGTVVYTEHVGDPTAAMVTVDIAFAGPDRFRYEVVAEQAAADGRLGMEGVGTAIESDGVSTTIESPGGPTGVGELFDPLRHLFWDGAGPAWSEICTVPAAATATSADAEVIAGRPTIHLACSTSLEDYEIWLDPVTGVVLKSRGPLGQGDLRPIVARDGGFEFTSIVFGERSTLEVSPEPSSPTSLPVLHFVKETTWENRTSQRVEVWYVDSERWRETFDDGTFSVRNGNDFGFCIVGEEFCESVAVDQGGVSDVDLPDALRQPDRALVADVCNGPESVQLLGRETEQFTCNEVAFQWNTGDHWTTYARPGVGGWWFDVATGLVLRHTNPFATFEVIEIEIDANMAPDIFDYVPLPFDPPPASLALGDVAPDWTGQYLAGGTFRLRDLRGRPAVVFDWCPTCGPINMEGLADFQELYERFGDRVEFIVASEEPLANTRRIIDRQGITVPVVYCFLDQIDPQTGTNTVCDPDSPWGHWALPVPSWTIIDADGTVVYLSTGKDYDPAVLETLIAEIASR